MKLLIVSNAPLIKKGNHWFAYAPYVKELEIWTKYAEEVAFCCPEWKKDKGLLITEIPFSISKTFLLSDFNIKSVSSALGALFQSIYNFMIIIKAMYWANHIHLRCPGNVGLLASIAQLFFPHKIKTAKYAGNWDPKAKHPLSYRLQKNILKNTFLTRNMQVLVYGIWEGNTKNIKPFFTATYKESDKQVVLIRNLNELIKIIFIGTLTTGKQPLYAIQLIEKIINMGIEVQLSIYGEGEERIKIEKYILENSLGKYIYLYGNQPTIVIQKAYQESHFVILPSQSEGWPKVIAEGMFWGCVPLATKVSCVPYMLDYGNNGLFLEMDLEKDLKSIQELVNDQDRYQMMLSNGVTWSRKYTLDTFEAEIKLLLQS
jgi:glycosyltransferase involved in cell wall biosynthesis